MTYLLDTQVWLWLLDSPERLSAKAQSVLKRGRGSPFGVASISCWEIARKESEGKLAFTLPCWEWLNRAATSEGVRLVELSPGIAWEACHLPGTFHRDPADQIIVATARILGLVVMTRDERILQYEHVRTLAA